MRQQVGALPVRWTGDEPRVLLVTSRETQRWIIPKGWRMRGRSNAEAAAQEALEEAGVRGRVRNKPIGRYVYAKRRPGGAEDCKITTYLLEVTDELDAFPEMAERQRSWFTIAEAEACADDEGLRDILRTLGPRLEGLRSRDRKAAKRRAKAADKDAPPKASDVKSAPSKTPEPKARRKKASGGKASEAPSGAKRSKRARAAAQLPPGEDPEAGVGSVGSGTDVHAETTGDEVPPASVAESDVPDVQARKRTAGKVARIAGRRRRKATRKALAGTDDTPQAAE